MSEGIVVALIGAGAVVIAALIGLIAKATSKTKTQIKQKQKGNGNTQIGIQNNKGD